MIPVYKTIFLYLHCITFGAISHIFKHNYYSWNKRAVIPFWSLCNSCRAYWVYQLNVIYLKKIRAASPSTLTAGGVATACWNNYVLLAVMHSFYYNNVSLLKHLFLERISRNRFILIYQQTVYFELNRVVLCIGDSP